MNLRVWVVLFVVGPTAAGWNWLDEPDPAVVRGNRAVDAGQPRRALDAYRQASRPETPAVLFNMGVAHYRIAQSEQGEARALAFERARNHFRTAASSSVPTLRASALYNLGNTLAELGHTREAIVSFKQALRTNPGHDGARYNLEVQLRKFAGEQADIRAKAAARKLSNGEPTVPPATMGEPRVPEPLPAPAVAGESAGVDATARPESDEAISPGELGARLDALLRRSRELRRLRIRSRVNRSGNSTEGHAW